MVGAVTTQPTETRIGYSALCTAHGDARKAAHDIDGVEPCDIELSMPRPSYTIDTLRKLAVTYPDKNFKLIIGSDNWLIFDRWRDHDKILTEFGVLVYPRYGYEITEDKMHERMRQVHAPIFEISSTMIRQGIADGRDMRAFVPKEVYEYIILNKLYKTDNATFQ